MSIVNHVHISFLIVTCQVTQYFWRKLFALCQESWVYPFAIVKSCSMQFLWGISGAILMCYLVLCHFMFFGESNCKLTGRWSKL